MPAVGADATELRANLGEADVAADEVRLGQRHVERDVVVELETDDLAQAVARIQFRDTPEKRDAVLEVDDEIALHQVGEVEQLVHLCAVHGGALGRGGAARALAAEKLGLRDDDERMRGLRAET